MSPMQPANEIANSCPDLVVGTPRPPFVVGITGHMEIADENAKIVRQRIENVLTWLRYKPLEGCQDHGTHQPLGLYQTPILVLTSLAPGADQIAANVALELGCQVQCPLPFPTNFYINASTFRRGEKNEHGSIAKVDIHDKAEAKPVDRELGLPILTAEDESRRTNFKDVLDKIGSENAFHVMRPEDISLSDDELEELLANDLRDRVRRNMRYRSAGDYISSNCDVLLAICDLDDFERSSSVKSKSFWDQKSDKEGLPAIARCGAREIVDSHIFGIEPGTLPIDTTLTWADNGPVIRIFCPNMKGHAPQIAVPTRIGSIKFWHPRDSEVPGQFEVEWHEKKLNELRTFANHLEELNLDLASIGQAEPDQASRLFATREHFVPKTFFDEPLDRLNTQWKAFSALFGWRRSKPSKMRPFTRLDQLEKVASFRRNVAELNAKFDGIVKLLTARLFFLTFTVIVLLQVFENWATKAMADQVPLWRSVLFCCAFFVFLFSLTYYYWIRRKNVIDKQNDYRAIAEGVRVQFYWMASGLSASAASCYLQRARGELSWIREVIAWAGFPSENSVRGFSKKSHEEKFDALRLVVQSWINEQTAYFSKGAHKQSNRKAKLHFIANTFLVAGFAMILTNFTLQAFQDSLAAKWIERNSLAMSSEPIVLFISATILVWVVIEFSKKQAYHAYYVRKSYNFWARLAHHAHYLHSHLWFWLAGVWLGWSVLCLIKQLPIADSIPTHLQLSAIAKNLLLAIGGLLHSWAAFKFLDENTKRYSAARDLFQSTQLKLQRLIGIYENQIANKAKQEELDRTVRGVQDYLLALGREALQENADWLVMHRNKPVEPVLPVG